MRVGPSHQPINRQFHAIAGCLTLLAVATMSGCSYWPAVRESYGHRVRILDGAIAAPARFVVVRAKVLKLRYPHQGWKVIAIPSIDVDSTVPTPVLDKKHRTCPEVDNEPDGDDTTYISRPIFITAMAYLKIVGGNVPRHSGARYIDLDLGNDQIMESYLSIGRIVTLRFTPGGRLYDIPHAPP